MDRTIVSLAVIVGSAALFGASTPAPSAREMEVTRLVRHFDSVDLELRSRDVSHYTASQRANRAKLVSWLLDYRNAGSFPTNDRFAEPTPFFRDKDGVLCAMAYLIARSGRTDIVDKVAATRNNAFIRDLVDDPALVTWLDSWGLTAGEAARIQPSYGGDVIIYPDDDYVESDFALAALGLGSQLPEPPSPSRHSSGSTSPRRRRSSRSPTSASSSRWDSSSAARSRRCSGRSSRSACSRVCSAGCSTSERSWWSEPAEPRRHSITSRAPSSSGARCRQR